jgi:LPXTG-motif cell wall-anchored protein
MSVAGSQLLAQTGTDLTPWIIVAIVVVVLGIAALVVARVVRSRRERKRVSDEGGPISPDAPR